MPWIKLDDDYFDHPKIASMSNEAFRLWHGSLSHCARYLTDGFVPVAVMRKLASTASEGEGRSLTALEELVALGSLEEDVPENGGRPVGYLVHDWDDYQPSRAAVLADREAKARAGRAGAKARWHSDDDLSST